MKVIALIVAALALTACSDAMVTSDTSTCDGVFNPGWGMNLGTEVESSSNLDSNRCVEINAVWCCVL